jgi:WD40 repeat protein
MGAWRAVKFVHRRDFDHDRPFERELAGIERFEPISRSHPSPESTTPDGRRILLWKGNPPQHWSIQLFDLETAELTGPLINVTRLAGFPNRMRFSPDGTRLAMVGADQMGKIIDLATGELAGPQFKHRGNLLDLDWNPNGTRLTTTGRSPHVKMWFTARALTTCRRNLRPL